MSFVLFVLPPLLGYIVMAVLAVRAQTHALRVAIWPVVTLLAYRAAVSVDLSHGELDRKIYNTLFVISMFFIVARTFEWMLSEEPLTRCSDPVTGSRSSITDVMDLITTLRGNSWSWSRGVYIPPETRPTNRTGFTFRVVLSAALHAFICGTLCCAIRSFSPTGLGAQTGGSIFDETLPFRVRHLRASVITVFASFAIYAGDQALYNICTLLGVLVFRQDPSQWPPAFDAPWRATSLVEFWGRRWHQFFRRTFIFFGGHPLSFILGRFGFVMGSFLMSGLLHHLELCLLYGKPDAWRLLVGMGILGLLTLAEWTFKQVTGKKVGGVVGWVWTMGWLVLLGGMVMDGFARGGVFGHFNLAEGVLPMVGREMVQRWVVKFDDWLHAM